MTDVKKAAEIGKKISDVSKRQTRELKDLKTKTEFLSKRPDSGSLAIDVKYAGKRLESTNAELKRLQSEFKKYS